MKKRLLSPEQAFEAMSLFVERYYERTKREGEIGALLGDMQINPQDGLPADPAAWDDWLAVVSSVLASADAANE